MSQKSQKTMIAIEAVISALATTQNIQRPIVSIPPISIFIEYSHVTTHIEGNLMLIPNFDK